MISTLEAKVEAFWAEHGYRFGTWEFLPETGEIKENGVITNQLSPVTAECLRRLIEVYPEYIAGDERNTTKEGVFRIRKRLGKQIVEANNPWGYRFNPAAVMRDGEVLPRRGEWVGSGPDSGRVVLGAQAFAPEAVL